MSKKSVGGRPAIYSPKDGKVQVRAITSEGARIMNMARRVVKGVSGWAGKVSDGDVIDYILRCWRYSAKEASEEIEQKR